MLHTTFPRISFTIKIVYGEKFHVPKEMVKRNDFFTSHATIQKNIVS